MRRRHWRKGVNGGRGEGNWVSRLVSGRIEVVGDVLRDCLAVNERTLTGPVRLVVSIALLS